MGDRLKIKYIWKIMQQLSKIKEREKSLKIEQTLHGDLASRCYFGLVKYVPKWNEKENYVHKLMALTALQSYTINQILACTLQPRRTFPLPGPATQQHSTSIFQKQQSTSHARQAGNASPVNPNTETEAIWIPITPTQLLAVSGAYQDDTGDRNYEANCRASSFQKKMPSKFPVDTT